MKELIYIASAGRFSLWIETLYKWSHAFVPRLYRFQQNGWHLHWLKLRLTRAPKRRNGGL